MKRATVVLMCTLAYSSIASAHQTGSQLLQWCQAGEPVGQIADRMACYGYLLGMWEMFDMLAPSLAPEANIPCLPGGGIEVEQMRLIVVKWLRNHPENLLEGAGLSFIAALKNAFPCDVDKPRVKMK
jgi:hypothetical protein